MKYIYAGNRDIGADVLEFMTSLGHYPKALLLTDENDSHIQKMIRLSKLPDNLIFKGKNVLQDVASILKMISPDYIIGIHYPYLIKDELLSLPQHGFLNLHPAYLPYNRGWHTPSWAIYDATPAGATLHFMSKELDMGDIIHQKKVPIEANDTANSLYKKMKSAELEVFKEAFDDLKNFSLPRKPQSTTEGTVHKKKELFEPSIAELDLNQHYQLAVLLDKIRALTTNNISEACYFTKAGKKYRLTINIIEDTNE